MPLTLAIPVACFLFVLGFLAGRWDLRSFHGMHRGILLRDMDALHRSFYKSSVPLTAEIMRAMTALRADIADLT